MVRGQPATRRARAAARAVGDAPRRCPADDVARGERPIERGRGAQVVAEGGIGGQVRGREVPARADRQPDHAVGDLVEADAGRLGLRHEAADDVVGGTERHAATDQRVGQRGRRGVALAGGFAHPGRVHAERLDQAGHHPERGLVHLDRVEQRGDPVLEVALVGQGQALEQGQDPGQLPDDAGSAAADQLGRVGVLLVGHHRAAGREGIGDAHEPEPWVRPPGDLLGEPAEVDHPERDRRHRLDREVAVRDGVERVRADAIEAKLRGRRLAVERVARARQRACAERRDVDPPARVRQPAAVALGHLDIGEQVMREQHRLGGLDVGRAGQDGHPLALGQADQRPLEIEQRDIEVVDGAPRPQAQVRGDLVVARTAGVEAPGERADPLGQRRLEVHMDVLERRVPGEPARRDVGGEGGKPVDEGRDLVSRKEPGAAESADVGDRAGDVVGGERRVDLDRAREVGDARVRLAAEPPAPGPHRASVVRRTCYPPGRTLLA